MALRFTTSSGNLIKSVQKSAVRSASVAAREVLQKAAHPELTQLKNGLRVATEHNARSTATVGLWIDSGSRYENESNNGVAQFLEHMVYKGTGKRSQKQLETELESIGARLNSVTSREHTAYYAQCASEDVEKVVDILADVVRNSKLDDAVIEKERQIIAKQLEESDSNHHEVTFDNLHLTAFQGTPLARSVLGLSKNIQSITKQDLKEFTEDHYKPIRMVLTGVGGVDHEKLVQLSEKYFGDLSNEYPRKVPEIGGVRFSGSEYLYRDDTIPHMYGAVAVEGVGFGHMDSLPLSLASTFVGNWDRTQGSSVNAPSKLAQKLSQHHDLHLFSNFNISYKDTGLFGVYFIMNGENLDYTTSALRQIQKEWKHLTAGVTNDEIDRAKALFKTQIFKKLEGNTARADDIAKQVLYTNKINSLAEFEQLISKVDASAVQGAMSRHVYDRDFAAAGVGRTDGWFNYHSLRYGMSWWKL